MNHIDQHTLELYALKLTQLEMSSRQIERHLAECAGCRELYQEIEEFYERATQIIQEAAQPVAPADHALAKRTEPLPVHGDVGSVANTRWNPNVLGRLFFACRRHPAVAGTGVLMLGAMVWALFSLVPRIAKDNNPAYASLNPGSSKLEAYNNSNSLLWSIPVTGIDDARLTETSDHLPSIVVTDIDGDGRNEVVATLKSIGEFRAREGVVLAVLSPEGNIRWKECSEHPVQFRGETLPGAWLNGGILVADFNGDGSKEIICRAISGRSPSAILKFDSDGRLQGEYWHFGHLVKIVGVDFARSGKTRLLLAGIDDTEGGGDFGSAVVTLLDPGRVLGKTEAGATRGFGYAPSGAEDACSRLPNTKINVKYHSKPGIDGLVVDTSVHPQTASVWWSSSVPGYKLVLEYIFGPDLVLRTLRSSDATIRLLTNLQQKGELTSGEIDQFLPSLRAGVEYWNGADWQKTPGRVDLNIPRDTSFTTRSAAAKVLREYPRASAVVPFLPGTVAVRRDLVYASYGMRKMHLDLFEPGKIAQNLPAILFIHGGGWGSGDRSMEEPLAESLAAAGFVTATVEYRLSPEARFPAAVLDLKAAVRWLRAHAADYRIDTARIGVCGGSAGGHLAAFLGATNEDRKYDAGDNLEYSSQVQAVVDIDGPLDLTVAAESARDADPRKPSAGRRWIGYSFAERPDLWREASPLFHAGRKTPPIAFINSSIDRFHAGRDQMIAILAPAGIYSEVHRIPDTPHPFWLFHPWFEETAAHVEAFFARFLKK